MTLVLLFMLMYVLSIVCMQVISAKEASMGYNLPDEHKLKYYFGSLDRSMLTLFETIVGGISWDEIAEPLRTDIHPFMALFLCFYVVVACYAISNMMTGMFVQKAMQFTAEDSDKQMADCIRELCFKPSESDGGVEEITFAMFE